ncbi:hypothetical protein GCM10027578_02020 [Spirosoma luteolum]
MFVRWVKHPDDEEVAAHWNLWLSYNPRCADTVETARFLIRNVSQFPANGLSPDETASVWGRIRGSLQTMEDLRPLQPDVRTMVGWWYFFRTMAAAVGLVLLVGWAVWMQYGPNQLEETIRTTNEPPRLVQLPDGSRVKLYPNSQLRYNRQGFTNRLSDEAPRAVWLDGEADFTVAQLPDTASAHRFRVHTSDVTVEAAGTDFAVRHCPEGTRVALRSGIVNLLVSEHKPMRLLPGQAVEVAGGLIQALP